MSKAGQDEKSQPQKQWMSHWKIKVAPRTAPQQSAADPASTKPTAAPSQQQAQLHGVPPQPVRYATSRPVDIARGTPRPNTPEISSLSISPGSTSAGAGAPRPPMHNYVHHWKVDSRGSATARTGPPASATGSGSTALRPYQPGPGPVPPQPMVHVQPSPPKEIPARAVSPGRTHPYRETSVATSRTDRRQRAPHRAASPSLAAASAKTSPGLQRTYPHSVGSTPPGPSYLGSTPPMADPMHPFNLLLSSVERQLKLEEEEDRRAGIMASRKPHAKMIKEESSGSDTEPLADVDGRMRPR